MSNELVVTQDENVLVQYGSTQEIKALGKRIRLMMPGGRNYTDTESFMLAQLAIAHNLNPFNGEVWLPKNKKTGEVLGSLIGIKGHRKLGKRQAEYWGVGNNGGFTHILDPERLKEYNATPQDTVYTYEICDNVTQNNWLAGLTALTDAKFTTSEAREMMGDKPPTILGIGIYKAGELSKMKPNQCAMFRAEKDALKRRFDVPFEVYDPTQEGAEDKSFVQSYENSLPPSAYDRPEGNMMGFELEGELEAVDNGSVEVLDLEFEDEAESYDEYDDEPQIATSPNGDRPYAPEVLKAHLAEWAELYPAPCEDRHRNLLASVLNTVFEGDEESRYELCNHLTGHASTKDIPDAYVQAMLKTWAEISGWNQPPSELMIKESHSLLTYLRKEAGQQELSEAE